jgi:uncharacterized membrane protein YbaN (DUF454 family)
VTFWRSSTEQSLRRIEPRPRAPALDPGQPVDYSHEVRAHNSRLLRLVFAGFGTLCVGIGLVGAVLPVLPTTPFMLLAAGCYVRASPRFYNWLLNTRAFGPLIREWRQYRSIPWRTKLTAIALMAATLSTSIVFFVQQPYAQVAMALFGCALAIWLYRIPSRDRPRA